MIARDNWVINMMEITMVRLSGLPKIKIYNGTLYLGNDLTVQIASDNRVTSPMEITMVRLPKIKFYNIALFFGVMIHRRRSHAIIGSSIRWRLQWPGYRRSEITTALFSG